MKGNVLAYIGGAVLAVFVGLLLMSPLFVRVVDNRHVGCYSTFGQISTEESPPGLKVVIPFIRNIKPVPITNQTLDYKDVPVLTKDGLQLKMDVTIWYRLKKEKACDAYLQYGNIEEALVIPTIRSDLRAVAAEFSSSDFYAGREVVNAKVLKSLTGIKSEYFEVVDVKIRNIVLPPQVTKAIQQKLVAQQEAERMKFVLEKERREAERKRVEAQGIADANKIISGSLTPEYLQWYQIEMLRSLANSPNSTFMIVPYSDKLLPGFNTPMLTRPVK